MGVKKEEFFKSLLNKREDELDELLTGARVLMAKKDEARVEPFGSTMKGLPGNIDPTKPPKNFRDAMSREDSQEWAETYDAQHQGFYEHQTLTISVGKTGTRCQDLGYNNTYRVEDCEWAIHQAQGPIVCDG